MREPQWLQQCLAHLLCIELVLPDVSFVQIFALLRVRYPTIATTVIILQLQCKWVLLLCN